MPHYYFHLRDGADLLQDDRGTWLPDVVAAEAHAGAVARELMNHRERESRHCRIEVHQNGGGPLVVVLFAKIDRTLDHLEPRCRRLVEDVSAIIGDVKATIFACVMTSRYSRALDAQIGRRPYLIADRGRRVV